MLINALFSIYGIFIFFFCLFITQNEHVVMAQSLINARHVNRLVNEWEVEQTQLTIAFCVLHSDSVISRCSVCGRTRDFCCFFFIVRRTFEVQQTAAANCIRVLCQ